MHWSLVDQSYSSDETILNFRYLILIVVFIFATPIVGAEPQPKPAEPQPKPAEPQPKPVEPQPKPAEPQHGPADWEYFEKKIRPILHARCYSCHSSDAKTVHGGLRLDNSQVAFKGGDSGPAIVAEKPESSLLLTAIQYDNGDLQMPPKGKLPDQEIAELSNWIKRGAPYPPTVEQPTRDKLAIDFEEGRKFWSFQPILEQPLPALQNEKWPRQRIDWFVLAAMERESLKPADDASRAMLIRRVYFDLVGLPPTPEEVQQFVDDRREDAYELIVERLLNSPHFGERWARHWLDLARYTDKNASWLSKTAQAHLYRDWVVQAFNDDMRYDEFIHRQLATDMISNTGAEDMPALGFLGLSPNYWKELKLPCEIIKVIVADEWEERVDAVSRTFLGLTVACARCHDHKFDPISTEDYYAMAGVFASCRLTERPLIAADLFEPVKIARAKVAGLETELAKLKKQKPIPQEKVDELAAEIESIKISTPNYDVATANAVAEESLYIVRAGKKAQDGTKLDYRSAPRDLNVFIRGNPNRLGDPVPRRFLTILSEDPKPFSNGSGRLELAQAITNQGQPLTARVIVNRIWKEHFGRGLVETLSNFGRLGDRPSHPELLDDLAARFVKQGWSLKSLHREIVLSAAYRQTSQVTLAQLENDPSNKWLSRMNSRRLDVESWRDAMLAASGQLDRKLGGVSTEVESPANLRRTLYATIHRRDMSKMLQIHDFPDPTAHSPKRMHTTTALQGLYVLNGPLLAQQSEALTQRVQKESPNDTKSQITRAYWLTFSRSPTDRELDLGLKFLEAAEDSAQYAKWTQYSHALLGCNEFLFVD
ncbi:MAG: mono/diheme cytochrome c family protein [Pirellulaceae bacterium]